MIFIEKDTFLTYNLNRGEFMSIIWFVAFLILLIIEIITINLVTIWFAIGAVAAMITTLFTDSVVVQVVVFLIVSVVSLLLTKPIMKTLKKFDIQPTNSDRVIGKTGEVIKPISGNEYGEVKVYGNVWTASSNQDISVGEKVKVISIDGVKLIVEKEEE